MSKLSTISKMTISQIVGYSVGKIFGIPLEHAFYNRVLNLPSPFWSPRHPWQRLSAEQGGEMIQTMSNEGIVAFPNFLTPEEVALIKSAIDQQIELAKAGKETDWEYRTQEEFWCSLNVLNINKDAADKVLDPDLLNVIEGYLKRNAFLSESDSRRLTPFDLATKESTNEKFAKGYSASHWHYDNRGRQVKVQIYLTDVTSESGQNFAFVKKSHKTRPFGIPASRFSDEVVEEMGKEITECFYPAGSALIFDSQGIHRMRRSITAEPRYSITYYFHPCQQYRVMAQKIHSDVRPENRNKMASMMSVAE